MVKKNYLGGLSILLALLFSILLGSVSTCYATISREYLDYTLDTLSQSSFEYSNKSMTSNYQSLLTDLKNNYANSIYLKILEFQTNNGYDNLTDVNMTTFVYANTVNNVIRLFFVFSNASAPNGVSNLGYLKLNTSTRNNKLGYIYNYDNNEPVKFLSLSFNKSLSTPSLTYSSATVDSYPNNSIEVYLNNFTFNSDYTVLSSDSIAGSGLPSLYVNDFNTSISRYMIVLDMNGNYNPVSPEPEPDSPSGDSGLGNITTPSGDNGGNINLQPIQQGLTDIQNQISGDSQRIINQISGDNQKIINDLTNSDTQQDSQSLEGQFEDMISSTSNIVDPTSNFFSWLIDNIRSVLNSTGNYNITVTLFGETYTIRSDFFTLPDGDLKTFLQMSFIAWFGWRIIKKIRYIIYAVQCVEILDASHNMDFNADIL